MCAQEHLGNLTVTDQTRLLGMTREDIQGACPTCSKDDADAMYRYLIPLLHASVPLRLQPTECYSGHCLVAKHA